MAFASIFILLVLWCPVHEPAWKSGYLICVINSSYSFQPRSLTLYTCWRCFSYFSEIGKWVISSAKFSKDGNNFYCNQDLWNITKKCKPIEAVHLPLWSCWKRFFYIYCDLRYIWPLEGNFTSMIFTVYTVCNHKYKGYCLWVRN